MIAAFLHLLLQLVAGWLAAFGSPAPPVEPVEPVQPAPVEAPVGAATVEGSADTAAPTGVPPTVAPPVASQPGPADPGCAAGEEWDGIRCVAVQLPEETDGRQIDP